MCRSGVTYSSRDKVDAVGGNAVDNRIADDFKMSLVSVHVLLSMSCQSCQGVFPGQPENPVFIKGLSLSVRFLGNV